MRGKEAKAGSLRGLLLILALLLANLTAFCLHQPERSAAQSKDPVAERLTSLGNRPAGGDFASLDQRRALAFERARSTALRPAEEHTP
jgi:hypothetical protein